MQSTRWLWLLVLAVSLAGFGYVLWNAQRDAATAPTGRVITRQSLDDDNTAGVLTPASVAGLLAGVAGLALINLVRPRRRPRWEAELAAIGSANERRVAKIVELTARHADEMVKEVV